VTHAMQKAELGNDYDGAKRCYENIRCHYSEHRNMKRSKSDNRSDVIILAASDRDTVLAVSPSWIFLSLSPGKWQDSIVSTFLDLFLNNFQLNMISIDVPILLRSTPSTTNSKNK
jgi:hypothetical protein